MLNIAIQLPFYYKNKLKKMHFIVYKHIILIYSTLFFHFLNNTYLVYVFHTN